MGGKRFRESFFPSGACNIDHIYIINAGNLIIRQTNRIHLSLAVLDGPNAGGIKDAWVIAVER